MGGFEGQPLQQDGAVNLNLVSTDDNNTGLESRFDVSPWDEKDDHQSHEKASSHIQSTLKVRRKKKKKVKRKVPKYPEYGYRLPCAEEIEEAYWATFWEGN